jgi:hypothetical protein
MVLVEVSLIIVPICLASIYFMASFLFLRQQLILESLGHQLAAACRYSCGNSPVVPAGANPRQICLTDLYNDLSPALTNGGLGADVKALFTSYNFSGAGGVNVAQAGMSGVTSSLTTADVTSLAALATYTGNLCVVEIYSDFHFLFVHYTQQYIREVR